MNAKRFVQDLSEVKYAVLLLGGTSDRNIVLTHDFKTNNIIKMNKSIANLFVNNKRTNK